MNGSIVNRNKLEEGRHDFLLEAVVQLGPISVDEKEQGLNVKGANIRGCLAFDRMEERGDGIIESRTFPFVST